MFEKFTDRARKVIQLANQEAQRLNHTHISTEHVLIGLCKEGSGVAANVLRNLDVDLKKLREETERLVPPKKDPVFMGKLPQTEHVKQSIQYALEESRNLNHNYVGTEHLLLGLLRSEGGANEVLSNLKITAKAVRTGILNLLCTHKKSPEDEKEKSETHLKQMGWGSFISNLPTMTCWHTEYEKTLYGDEVKVTAKFATADTIIKKAKEEERKRIIKLLEERVHDLEKSPAINQAEDNELISMLKDCLKRIKE
jgi:ATP-dependent Clp protease ATP-binding subunit ClpC